MASFIPFAQRRSFILASRAIALVLAVVAGLASQPSRADPGDFAAMPGLWKTVTTPVDHGHRDKPVIIWHCVDEGADPWVAFAIIVMPASGSCERSEQHRGSTALAWNVTCGKPAVSGKGRVNFDSAEHYTGSVILADRSEVASVEGQRFAACTSPSD
jgi:hypothetical protein